ncbi:SDR family NAD(P)-dependent oxidoreductase [Botrimarina sp.]|uniref:SDR family NAD(P)-dependent oxidoreductase n=1 Tax=Botrimarina sp. TaxID=2795802 RepID=UPI0032ECA1BA
MADLDRLAKLSPDQRNRLQQRLASRAAAKLRAAAGAPAPAQAAGRQRPVEPGAPIAVIGMSGRFAGAPDVEALWRMIRDGRDGVTEVPADRWNVDDFYDPAGGPGKSTTRRGAFVDGVDLFEPTFFGVTPREASRMDPQQRMLLEVAWETLENAGWPADRIAGSVCGVYVGVGGTDYMKAPVHSAGYYQLIDAHVGTGNALSIASNRVSYVLDLKGPSLSVDTACSSSSLAIHLAVQSLRSGESDAALAGGVNAILVPDVTIAFSQAHMLAPEGRCRSYDAAASGYVRGEGCALVMLKRLDDAQRDGDDILGVILGSAVNQDGRTAGIAAPSVHQQQACLHAALADAGISPADVDYVEGHGTGTPLGDPVELQALAGVFRGDGDGDRPLWVTSVKANIGHTETVSGVAGLIKTLLLMRQEQVPPQLHLKQLNPHAGTAGSRVQPLLEPQRWPSRLAEEGRRRIAGVSSFGFGGANTHIVVAEAPLPPSVDDATPDRPAHVVKLAAKTPDRVPEQAKRLADWLRADGAGAEPADVAYTANTGRCDFPHRVALVAADRDELLDQLDSVAAGARADDALPARDAVRSCWLFTGQGAQRSGMGSRLYDAEPVYRRVVQRCDAVFAELLGVRVADLLAEADDPRVHQTLYTQPALFAVECGLAELWGSWGARPDVVLGHSIGEIAAAVTAGVLTLEDGARLVAHRARLMHGAPGDGGMAVVFADAAAASEALEGRQDRLAIAAVNGPANTVLSGDKLELQAALADLRERGIESKRLDVSHAFHSPLMDPVLDEFQSIAGQIEHRPPRVPIASNVKGRLLTDETAPADWSAYWRDHLRNTVRFTDGVAAAAATGATHWIEVGPAPVLAGMAAKSGAAFAGEPRWIPSLRPSVDDTRAVMAALASHWAGGGYVDWRGVYRGRGRRRLPLPNYPMKRERFWYENLQPAHGPNAVARAGEGDSPTLGARLPVATGGDLYEAPVDDHTPAWIGDHRVSGSIVAPASLYLEQALAAACSVADGSPSPVLVTDVEIRRALTVADKSRLRVQTHVEGGAYDRRSVSIHAAPSDQRKAEWVEHAVATIRRWDAAPAVAPADRQGVEGRAVQRLRRAEFYRQIGERGLEYGPAFRVLEDVYRSEYDAFADLAPHKSVAAEVDRYRLHPVLGDALLQTVACTLPLEADGSNSPYTYLPVRVESVRSWRAIKKGEPLHAYAVRRDPAPSSQQASPNTIDADAWLLDGDGRPIVELRGVRAKRLADPAGRGRIAKPTDWLYQTQWRPAPLTKGATGEGPVVVFGGDPALADSLARRALAAGSAVVEARFGDRFASPTAGNGAVKPIRYTIDPTNRDHFARVLAELPQPPSAVVCLAGIEIADSEEGWSRVTDRGAGAVLRLLQAVGQRPSAEHGVIVVTRGGQSVGSAAASPVQAATVGLCRSAMMERPELRVRLVDLPVGADDAGPVWDELAAAGDETQVAHRDGQRLAPRLAPAEALASQARQGGAAPPRVESWRLGMERVGSFDTLRYAPHPREAPGDGEVEIQVHATGLNFSDVLKALGLYPGVKEGEAPLGIEASGVVVRVGPGVEHLRVGDEAIGVGPNAFASHMKTRAYAVVPKPPGVTHAQGATIPIVFLTAHHALVDLARLERGERVLIHAGAGGVGLAALQVAQHAGAEVFATAGSDRKRDLLRSLGVAHVMDSRSLEFVDRVREATGGEGVDVVLNSLPGEAIDASLGLLRAYGRFCEIGKIDIYRNRKIGLQPFQDNLSYFAIDLDRLLRERPRHVRELFAAVMRRFAEGAYRPLEVTEFPTHEVVDAFRYMSQRKNIGKVVVSMRVDEAAADRSGVVRGGGYLVTGGLGALGRKVAQWLAANGAGGVALLSRRAAGEADRGFLEDLEGRGVQAVALRGDVADAASLDAALAGLPEGFPPVAGVIHAAGVLDDALLDDLNGDRLEKVLMPKAIGAWNLHNATRRHGSPLAGVEQFVLFSSVAATLGSPGQANYAAANAALDALAAHRRQAGLPAVSVAWGPWGDDHGSGAGMASGDTARAVAAKGMGMLPPEPALALLGDLLRTDPVHAVVVDARWDAMSRLLAGRKPPLLEGLLVDEAQAPGGESPARFRLLDAAPAERLGLIAELVHGELARVTNVPRDEIKVDQPLTTLGIDSLMALELKNNLESKLAITLPMSKLLAGPSVTTLAEAALDELVGESPDRPGAAEESWRPLVQLAAGADGSTPLVFMPVLGGDVGAYRYVTAGLPPDRPVYAVRPRGLDSAQPPHKHVGHAAEDYAAAIVEAFPGRAVELAGWSTGGITALAVTQALERRGARVERVTLLDSPPPGVYDRVDTDDDAVFLASILDFAARFSGKSSMAVDSAALAELDESQRFAATLAEAQRAGIVPGEVDEAYVRRLVAVGEALVVATRAYQHAAVHAPVEYVRAAVHGGLGEVTSGIEANVHAWRELLGDSLSEHEAPGDHFSMMSGEGAAVIARVLAQAP